MHTFIKYLGAVVFVALLGIWVFGAVFADRPVWQSKAVTIIVGVITLVFFLLWLWFGRPSVGMWWKQM